MTKVLDANVLTYIASGDPRRIVANNLINQWLQAGETLHAPDLAPYEIANGLTRLVATGLFPPDRVQDAIAQLSSIPVTMHAASDLETIITIASRLGRRSAYDAAYIALAEQLSGELWTFDGPLARNATSIGFPVHLIIA